MTEGSGVDYSTAVAILTALEHGDHVSNIPLLHEAATERPLSVLLAMTNLAHSSMKAYADAKGTTVADLLRTLGPGTAALGDL